ncbi:MAG: flagellar motor protein MotB [Planctomycetota bacterium]
MSRSQKNEEKGPKVPAYIVTFSDMVTLLLTFFVMLLTLAVQDPSRYKMGRNSFIKSMRQLGLGIFTGWKVTPDFGEVKVKYYVSEPDKQSKIRTVDAKKENLQRLFKEIAQSMKTTPSQIVAQKANFSVTNISFSPGGAQLNEPAKRFLIQFAANLEQDAGFQRVKLYVLGLANDEQNEKKQWILSAMRAQAAADFLTNVLPSHLRCPVYSWGAGSGGRWVTRDSPVSEHSQILIGVLSVND